MSNSARLIQLVQGTDLSAGSALTDTDLLHRYAAERDEIAFAELVRRNGPLVLRTCRHVLGEAHADDAFQTVFLLLARSADRLTGSRSLAGWLHAAAVRIAQRVRRGEQRRRKREVARVAPLIAPDELTWKEIREVLDAEIAALPERYRLPLVLCYLQELTHEQAARHIGCAVGVLRGRLDRGRERLRRRLVRRGLPSAASLLVAGVPATVSAARVASTVRVVMTSAGSAAPSAIRAVLGSTTRWRAVLFAPVVAALAFVLAAAGQPMFTPPASNPPLPGDRSAAKTPAEPATDPLGDPLPPGAIARLGTARFHHGENIHGVIVGADGKLVASVGGGKYKLWAGDTGKSIPLWDELAKATEKVGGFGIVPADGGLAAVLNDRDGTRLVDPVTGKLIRTLPPINFFQAAQGLAPNGKTLVVFQESHSTLRIWDADKDRWTDLDSAPGQPHQGPFCFSADSRTLAFYKFDGAIDVWDLPSGKCVLRLSATRQPAMEAFTLSADGALLAREAGVKLQVWNVKTGKELLLLADQPKNFGFGGLAFSPDGKVLAGSGTQDTIRLWDVAAGKKLRDIQCHYSMMRNVVFSGDGKRLYLAEMNGVRVWDPVTGKPLDDVGGNRRMISDAKWSPDGKRLVSTGGYTDNVARVWDPTTGRKVFDIVGHKSSNTHCPASVSYSPDGSLLATGCQDGTTRLLDPTTGKELHSFAAKDGGVYALAFTPHGRFLVTGGRKALHVWDVAERKEARSIPNNGDVPFEITFLRDGQSVMVRDWWSKTRVIDFATGREETAPAKGAERTTAVAVSPTDRYLADADQDGTTHLVDAVTGREILAITGPAPTQENPQIRDIWGLAVSPDGRTVASAHRNREVRVYEVASGAELFRFVGHTDEAMGVRFSPDGSRLCSFAADQTLLIWDVTGARLAPAPAPKSADTAWMDLMSADAKKGFAAIRYLSADPPAALRLVTAGVKPVASVDPKVVAGLIEKLGSSEFAEREGASKDLVALAPAALDQLRAVAGKSDSQEVRARLGTILSKVGGPKLSGERLRALRAVELLERVGTPEARNVLTRLAAGASGAALTRAAEAALGRIKGTK